MGRTKGTYTLTSNIEPKVGAPLDARTIVKLLADLTASNTFEYPYKGMKVFVEENNKSYTLVGSDPTVSTNWIEDNSGGHTIKNPAGTAMTQRSNLQFVDLTVSDDSINDITKVENIHVIQSESELDNLPDGLYMLDDDEGTVIDGNEVGYDNTDSGLVSRNVQDAIDEVVGMIPELTNNYYTVPQLIGTWIDGKPLYEFTLIANYSGTADIYMPSYVTNDWARIFMVEAYIYNSGDHTDVPIMRDINAFVDSNNFGRANMQYSSSNNIRVYVQNTLDNSKYTSYGSDIKYVFVIRYTKQTDTVLDNSSALHVKYNVNEQLIGTWIDGKLLYEKTYSVNMPNMSDFTVIDTQITGKIYLDNISYGRIFMTTGFVHTKVKERFIQCGPLNYAQGSNRTSANIQYDDVNQRFFLDFFDNYSQWATYTSDLWITFTVRYTKTTD